MKNIILEPTNHTPAIEILTKGEMSIKGRSMPENATKFYTPLIEWAGSVNSQEIKMDMDLEYMNSSSAKKILDLLRVLDANNDVKVLTINWYFEQGDEEVLECGKVLEDLLRKANFQYHEYIAGA